MNWQLAKKRTPDGIQYFWVKAQAPLMLPARAMQTQEAVSPNLRYITNANYNGGPVVIRAELVELMPEFADNVKRVHYAIAQFLDLPAVLELRQDGKSNG